MSHQNITVSSSLQTTLTDLGQKERIRMFRETVRRHVFAFLRTVMQAGPAPSGYHVPRDSSRQLANPSKLWWRRGDSNSRPPECDSGALPTELRPHNHRQPMPNTPPHPERSARLVDPRAVMIITDPLEPGNRGLWRPIGRGPYGAAPATSSAANGYLLIENSRWPRRSAFVRSP
jgi:hypothetical protein